MNDQIFETVVTTLAADGVPHVAPMGVRYRGDEVVLMPFKPSTTHDNIVATGHAVLNTVTDTRVFAGCVTGRKQWPTVPADTVHGVRLACALGHVELKLARRDDEAQRPVLHMARVHEAQHAPFIGLNRAQAAVLEGAVLVSRLHMLPATKIDTEMAYLQIAIDKTAGPEEHEAFGWLREYIAAYRAASREVARVRDGGNAVIKLLVSVRDVPEALLAARHGADFIDLKEPSAGALGGLPVETIANIVEALREQAVTLPISATIGDLGMGRLHDIVAQVHAVAACGVDYVKVGIERKPEAEDVLTALADSGRAVVPVFIADRGLNFSHVELACELGFPGIMVDTADKRAGSLFDVIDEADLRRFIGLVREGDRDPGVGGRRLVGLAGALRLHHLPRLARLKPDFAGFRSAVCLVDRGGTLDAQCLEGLVSRMRAEETPAVLSA